MRPLSLNEIRGLVFELTLATLEVVKVGVYSQFSQEELILRDLLAIDRTILANETDLFSLYSNRFGHVSLGGQPDQVLRFLVSGLNWLDLRSDRRFGFYLGDYSVSTDEATNWPD